MKSIYTHPASPRRDRSPIYLSTCIYRTVVAPPPDGRSVSDFRAPAMGKLKAKATPFYSRDDAYLSNVIPRRIALFESIKSQQQAHLHSIGGESIK